MTATALHIFRAGRQTPMSGAPLDFSEADLAACAAAYDPALHEAPIVVGHPVANAPAYGWVKRLSADGAGLHATPHHVDPAFGELVAAGRYKKISAAFYLPDSPANPKPGALYLRHVGFLGALPPAVKGLRTPEFAEGEEGVVEFGDWSQETNAGLWRRMRDWLISQFGMETADQVIPNWEINTIHDAAIQPESGEAAFSEENTVTDEQAAALEAENTALRAEIAALRAQLEAIETERRAAAAEQAHAANADFAERLVTEGRLAPKDKPLAIALLDQAGESPIEFGEGDQKQGLPEALRSFLSGAAPVVTFGDYATKGKASSTSSDAAVAEFAEKHTDPDRLTLHARAHALAAEKGIPYSAAIRQVIQSN